MKDIKESNRGEFNAQGKPQRDFIEGISEQVAGYMGGTRYALREWDLNKTEMFNRQANKFVGGEYVVILELHIAVEGVEE